MFVNMETKRWDDKKNRRESMLGKRKHAVWTKWSFSVDVIIYMNSSVTMHL